MAKDRQRARLIRGSDTQAAAARLLGVLWANASRGATLLQRQLIALAEHSPEGSLLYQDTSGYWTGVFGAQHPDVAILAAAGRGNVGAFLVPPAASSRVQSGGVPAVEGRANLSTAWSSTRTKAHPRLADGVKPACALSCCRDWCGNAPRDERTMSWRQARR